ncbi:unnamed protein product, partial [Ectocarpus sp. 12 AP-2014]
EGGKQAFRLKRKVVVRDEYVHSCEDDDIFLVDHAWTFQAGSAREQLRSCEPLLERMAALMQVQPSLGARRNNDKELAEAKKSVTGEGETDGEGDRWQQESGRDEGCCERGGDKARVLEGVLAALPTFSKRYGLGRTGMYASYVNDELGSAFRHSERPNCQ